MFTRTILIEYWKNSRERTMRYVKEAPLELMSYRPKSNSFSFIRQVLHIISWEKIMLSRLLDKTPLEDEITEAEIKNKEDLIQLIEKTTQETESKIMNFADETWESQILIDEKPVPFINVFLELIEHEAHHRGQLVFYFRLTNNNPPEYIPENKDSERPDALRLRPNAEYLLFDLMYQ